MTPDKKSKIGNEEDWGWFIALATVGVVLQWIWQGITWPFRALWRLIRQWL